MPSTAIFKRVIVAALAVTAYAATKSVSDWGDNPSKLPAMLVYTPATLPTSPAIIVGVSSLLSPLSRTGICVRAYP